MNAPDPRFESLFVRYWDNALSEAGLAEFEGWLLTDPAAREWFRVLSLQATTAAELASVDRLMESPRHDAPTRETGPTLWTEPAADTLQPTVGVAPVPAKWSRRRALKYAGGGVAASFLAGLGGWQLWGGRPTDQVRATAVRGTVTVATPRRTWTLRSGAAIPAGATVSTEGVTATVGLVCPDGSGVALTGDSSLIVHEGGRRMMLVRGNATADIRSRPDVPPLQLATAAATVTTATGALLNLGHIVRATEIVVQDGAVSVFDPAEHQLAVVGAGEMLTVQTGGPNQKRPTPVTPDEYVLPIAQRPLSPDWAVGSRVETPGVGYALKPHWWHDAYHGTEMWQVRSDKQWARGFYRLFPESTVHVRYWVDRAGPGQVIACVRKARLPDAETGVVEYNGAFEDAKPGQWNWLRVTAAQMLDNVHMPKFPAPWVAFLLIFNTYKADLGLRIAEYYVTPPGAV